VDRRPEPIDRGEVARRHRTDPGAGGELLRERAIRIDGALQDEIYRLSKFEIPQGEYSAEQARRRRREAFFRRFGVWPHGHRGVGRGEV
jgi:hypothetical protein